MHSRKKIKISNFNCTFSRILLSNKKTANKNSRRYKVFHNSTQHKKQSILLATHFQEILSLLWRFLQQARDVTKVCPPLPPPLISKELEGGGGNVEICGVNACEARNSGLSLFPPREIIWVGQGCRFVPRWNQTFLKEQIILQNNTLPTFPPLILR